MRTQNIRLHYRACGWCFNSLGKLSWKAWCSCMCRGALSRWFLLGTSLILPHGVSPQSSKFLQTEGTVAWGGVEGSWEQEEDGRTWCDSDGLTTSQQASRQSRAPTKQATASDFISKTDPSSLETSARKAVTPDFCVQLNCCWCVKP